MVGGAIAGDVPASPAVEMEPIVTAELDGVGTWKGYGDDEK